MQKTVRAGVMVSMVIASSFVVIDRHASAAEPYSKQEQQLTYHSSSTLSSATEYTMGRLEALNGKGEFLSAIKEAAEALRDSIDDKERLVLLNEMVKSFDGMQALTSDDRYASRAIEALNLVAKLNQNDPNVYLELARRNAAANNNYLSILLTRKAISLGADTPNEYVRLATYYESAGEYDDAIKIYDSLSKSGDVSAVLKRGHCHLRTGRYNSAVNDFRKVISTYETLEKRNADGSNIHVPEYPRAHYYLGEAYYFLGNYEKATFHYWKARQLNADHFCFNEKRAPWYGPAHEPTEEEEAEFRNSHAREVILPQQKGTDTEIEQIQRAMEKEREERIKLDEDGEVQVT